MYRIEVPAVGQDNCGKCERPAALYQTIPILSTIDIGARCDYCGNSGNDCSEACLCLHNAEAVMIIEEIWFLVNLPGSLLAKPLPDSLLALKQHIDLIKGAWVLTAKGVGYITWLVIFIRD